MGLIRQVSLLVDGQTFSLGVKAKEFKTGSDGYNIHGKVADVDGVRYQFNGNIVRIGSKKENAAKAT